MTYLRILSGILLVFLNLLTSYGQELVKKKKYKDGFTEEFFVLKDNKTIRQGATLITREDILDEKYIVELGQYSQDKKSGKWMSFYFVDPSNSLKSIGNYTNDQKDGDWRYYYPGNSSTESVRTLFGAEKKTNFIKTKKDFQVFKIEYDTIGQQISSTGKYREDKKVGIWNYYSRSGHLLHKYDHDSNDFLLNNLKDPKNDFLVYLGGSERFYNYYYMGQQELGMRSPITKTSEVVYEIEKDGNYKLVNAYGDVNYKIEIEQILKTVPNEWILLDGESRRKLHLISKIVVTENSFKKYKLSIDLKVIE